MSAKETARNAKMHKVSFMSSEKSKKNAKGMWKCCGDYLRFVRFNIQHSVGQKKEPTFPTLRIEGKIVHSRVSEMHFSYVFLALFSK